MTELQKLHGPFARPVPPYWGKWPTPCLITADSSARISEVKASTDRDWLLAVIRWDHSQQAVRLAAARRLRQLSKAKASV